MTQIAERTERPMKAALVAGGSVAAIVPQSIEECFRLSEAISQSGMAPYGLDTPQKVMIAMMSGLELGMPPMMAVQSIAVINNRPCMWGDALIGVVRSSSSCTYVKEWIEGDGDHRIAYCETLRKGEPEPVKRQFSVDDAKRAGLWQTLAKVTKQSKSGGTYEKDNDSPWYRFPQRMLQMRARAWCLRDTYPDVLKGMQVREEVEDYQHVGPDNAKDVTPKPSVMERLRANAQNSPESPASEREGFSASSVQQQTSRVLDGDVVSEEPHDAETGELSPNTEASDAHTPETSDVSGNVTSPDDVAKPAGDQPHSVPAGSVIPEKDLVILRRFAKDTLSLAAKPETSGDAMSKVLRSWFNMQLANLSEAGLEAAKGIKRSVEAIMKGDASYEAAVDFHAEGLGASPADLMPEGEGNG